MKAVLAAVAAAFTLSACQTIETWPTKEELATFGTNDSAIVVMDSTNNFGCARMNLGYSNVRTKDKFNRQLVSGEVGAIFAKPGRYHLYYADCSSAMGSLPGVELWFDSVDIKPNEVVYLGTFNLSAITVNSQSGVLLDIFSLGLTALTGKYNYYPTYTMTDDTENVRNKVRAKYPQFADRMVTRVPEAILSPEAFADAYRTAYANNPDGSRPTDEQAQARLDAEIPKAIKASIAKYRATHPAALAAAPPPPPAVKAAPAPAPAPAPASPQ